MDLSVISHWYCSWLYSLLVELASIHYRLSLWAKYFPSGTNENDVSPWNFGKNKFLSGSTNMSNANFLWLPTGSFHSSRDSNLICRLNRNIQKIRCFYRSRSFMCGIVIGVRYIFSTTSTKVYFNIEEWLSLPGAMCFYATVCLAGFVFINLFWMLI